MTPRELWERLTAYSQGLVNQAFRYPSFSREFRINRAEHERAG
jgi:hypothetical protein